MTDLPYGKMDLPLSGNCDYSKRIEYWESSLVWVGQAAAEWCSAREGRASHPPTHHRKHLCIASRCYSNYGQSKYVSPTSTRLVVMETDEFTAICVAGVFQYIF